MCRNDEILIHKRIQELNNILEKDEKDGELSIQEFNQFWCELHQLEHSLLLIYVKRFLKQKKKPVTLDSSLLYGYDEESDSETEKCKEHNETHIFQSHRKSDSFQR